MFNITPLVRNLIILNVAIFLLQNLVSGMTQVIFTMAYRSGILLRINSSRIYFARQHLPFFPTTCFCKRLHFAPILEHYWGEAENFSPSTSLREWVQPSFMPS